MLNILGGMAPRPFWLRL